METKHTKGNWLFNKTSYTILPNGEETSQSYTISTNTDFNQKSIANIRAKSVNDPDGLNHFLYSNEECVANAELICDAGNTFQKCHLLPSQLLQQRDELMEALKQKDNYILALCRIAKKGNPFCDPMGEAEQLIEIQKQQI